MAHNLFGDRFYSNRKPAWHGLGFVSTTDMGAVDAFGRVNPFTVSLAPLYSVIEGRQMELAQKAIIRHPVPDDPEYKNLGIVGPDYYLVDPLTVCEIYDTHVNRPIETLGALGKGETLFLSTTLPGFNVGGDEVENYMLIVSPYSGNSAIQVRLTPIRVVCQNTLIAAKAQTTESYRIVHNDQAPAKLGIWMGSIIQSFEQKSVQLAETFDLMSRKHVEEEDIDPLLELIYVDPKPFGKSVIPIENEKRQAWFEENLQTTRRRRQAVKEVFHGAGVGQDTPAAQGTAWGLYNSVVEYEQYRPTPKVESAAADMLFGGRASIGELAYSTLFSYVTR